MATTVRRARKFDRLTATEELVARVLEGRPIPKKLKKELLRQKATEKQAKAKARARSRRASAF